MLTIKKKAIYIPITTNTLCEKYNNGYIIWISGENSTAFQYLDNNKKNLSINLNKNNLKINNSNLTKNQQYFSVLKAFDKKKEVQYCNLIQSQLNKSVLNASFGIKKYLLVRGVGYKFIKKNQYLLLQIGYSHNINVLIPSFVQTKLNRKSTKIKFFTNNVAFLTGLLSSIRNYKKPDVYKGKGIRYRKDLVIRKEGKKKKTF